MAQLGAGLGSGRPLTIDTKQTFQNAVGSAPDSNTRIDSEVLNDILDALVKEQIALGANYQGNFGSLAARLNQFIPGGASAPGFFAFTNTTIVTIGGTLLGLGAPAVFFQIYDGASPAAAIGSDVVLVTVDQNTYDLTASFATTQNGILVVAAGAPQYYTTFTALTTLPIPGTVHQLGTNALLFQLYDNGIPAAAIEPQTLTVHPTTFDVNVTFGQAQSGTLVLGALGPNYVQPFTALTTVNVPGATHGLGTKALLFQVYDAAVPAAALTPETLTVHPTTFDVVATFGQPQSGRLVLALATPLSGLDFDIRDGGILDRTAVRMRSTGGNLVLQPGAGNHVSVREKTGAVARVDIDTATGRVGLGMTPSTHQLDLSTDLARKLSTSTWATLSDARLKDVLRPYTDGLQALLQLRPVVYRYNGKGGIPRDQHEYIGLLAQELQAVAPYMVQAYRGVLTPDEGEVDLLTVNLHALPLMLMNALQEMHARLLIVEAECRELHRQLGEMA